ncbi:MAG: septum site-determining protein MinC [Caloramator sp.]|nr:septum site-determining protein MinC [Caloramator sp.]
MGSIVIKGTKEGLILYLNSNNKESVEEEIINKFDNAKDFFKGSSLKIVDKLNVFDEIYLRYMQELLKDRYGINAYYENIKVKEETEKVFSGIYEGKTKFIKSTVRSGQRIHYQGNIVVIGDVNSGAEIIANGNIVILGALRGVVHAGANGNRKAIVAAYMLQPALLKIADITSRAPDEKIKPKVPEVAKVKDNLIVIEPYKFI